MPAQTQKTLLKKETALKFFSKKLLKNFKQDIKAIYLFGSLARGLAQKDSDIDILVFSHNPQKTSPAVWDISLETYGKFGESIEPLVYSSKKYKNPNSYFLYQAINNGKKLYLS